MSIKKTLIVLALACLALVAPAVASAADLKCGVIPQSVCDSVTSPASAKSPTDTIMPLVNFITNILVSLFGSVIVLIIIISAVQITASGGNEDAVKKGKENIFKAVTGLVLLISFRAIIDIINVIFGGGTFLGVTIQGVQTNSLFVGDSLAPAGIPRLIGNVTSIASILGGVLSVIFVIVGAIQYISSAGGDGVAKAKKTITYALTGLVISISAYSILIFIQSQLQK